jgi:hypothetical protein
MCLVVRVRCGRRFSLASRCREVPEDLEQRLTHAEGRDSARLLLLLARPLCGSACDSCDHLPPPAEPDLEAHTRLGVNGGARTDVARKAVSRHACCCGSRCRGGVGQEGRRSVSVRMGSKGAER